MIKVESSFGQNAPHPEKVRSSKPLQVPDLHLGQCCDNADIFNRVCPIWVIILNKSIEEFAGI